MGCSINTHLPITELMRVVKTAKQVGREPDLELVEGWLAGAEEGAPSCEKGAGRALFAIVLSAQVTGHTNGTSWV